MTFPLCHFMIIVVVLLPELTDCGHIMFFFPIKNLIQWSWTVVSLLIQHPTKCRYTELNIEVCFSCALLMCMWSCVVKPDVTMKDDIQIIVSDVSISFAVLCYVFVNPHISIPRWQWSWVFMYAGPEIEYYSTTLCKQNTTNATKSLPSAEKWKWRAAD